MGRGDNMENSLRLLQVKDLVELGLGRDKAYALMQTTSFPSIQIGKTYFVTEENFRKWLAENTGRKFSL